MKKHPSRKDQLANLLRVHPLPWCVAERRLTNIVVDILDANGGTVAALHQSSPNANVDTVVRLLVGALNKERARVVTEEMEKQNGL